MSQGQQDDRTGSPKLDEPEHHDPLLRHLTDWTRQVGEQPPSRVAPGIAAASRGFHDQLKALPTNTRLSVVPSAELHNSALVAMELQVMTRLNNILKVPPNLESSTPTEAWSFGVTECMDAVQHEFLHPASARSAIVDGSDAKALYEKNAAGYSNKTAWDDLHEDTKQLWRDEAAKRK